MAALVHALAAVALLRAPLGWPAQTVDGKSTILHLSSRTNVPLARSSRKVLSAAAAPGISSLRDLASAYDAFLLDQFGVIHDGKVAYPGATQAVAHVQRCGTKICIISNSSRRKVDTVARLRKMGFGPFDGDEKVTGEVQPISVVTSGDLVWEGLRRAANGIVEGLPGAELFADLAGKKCTVFGNGEDDLEYVTSCGCTPASIEEADFVMARGLFSVLTGLGDSASDGNGLGGGLAIYYSAELEEQTMSRAFERGLPLLVSNPDILRPDGKDSPMPGQLAQRYKMMGASDIRMVGKPHALIYEACRNQPGVVPGARLLGIGDSLPHDVLGAHGAGVDSAFICSGVHYQDLGVSQASDEEPDGDKLARLLDSFHDEHSCVPTHILRAFRL